MRALSTAGSPRTTGADLDHVRALAAAGGLPPIIVHRPTMRVIDGLHRLEAARLRGQETIAVRFFEGPEEDAFVLAVRANVAHGLPLPLADRKRAASRILVAHPQWSTRMVAAAAGISSGTVAEIRRGTLGEPGEHDVRIGHDGKVRPINAARGRRIATELIVEHPELSLRQIARAAGVSPETVRTLRNRLRDGGDAAAERAGEGCGGPSLPPAAPGRTSGGTAGLGASAVVERLKSDPALRFSEAGRELLRLLHINLISAAEWDQLAGAVPPHCRDAVVLLARDCAKTWAEFAQESCRVDERMDGRVSDHAG